MARRPSLDNPYRLMWGAFPSLKTWGGIKWCVRVCDDVAFVRTACLCVDVGIIYLPLWGRGTACGGWGLFAHRREESKKWFSHKNLIRQPLAATFPKGEGNPFLRIACLCVAVALAVIVWNGPSRTPVPTGLLQTAPSMHNRGSCRMRQDGRYTFIPLCQEICKPTVVFCEKLQKYSTK